MTDDPTGEIVVDPDTLAKIREQAPDVSLAEAYHKLITESITVDTTTCAVCGERPTVPGKCARRCGACLREVRDE